MNSAEARTILAAWRDGLRGTPDPEVQAALALTVRDPELAAWWRAQQAFHRAAAAALRDSPPPPDLAARILAARRIQPVEFSPRPRFPAWLAAAAAVLVLATSLWFALRPRLAPAPDFEVFRSRMVRAVLREYRMDVVTNDLVAIRQFLSRHQAPADFELDPALARVPALGAGLLSWQGKPVSMVCLDGGGLGTLFLFVAAAETTVPEPPAQPEITPVNRLATASWTRNGRTYVLAAVTTPERLREWLTPASRADVGGSRTFAAVPACHRIPALD